MPPPWKEDEGCKTFSENRLAERADLADGKAETNSDGRMDGDGGSSRRSGRKYTRFPSGNPGGRAEQK